MGEASTTAEDGDHEEDHGTPMGVAIGLNVAINAVLNAGFGYAIAWLHWQDYTLSWYVHELHGLFELDFVVEDVIVQGVSVGVIVTLIVAAILHRQWDADHLRPGRVDRFLLPEERTRGRHLLVWAGGMALMGFTVSVGIVALLASGEGEIAGSTFALARTVNGFVVGGIAGGFVTASWVTNLSAGKLVEGDGADTVVARTMTRSSQRPWIVLAAVALATAGLGAGVADLHVNVNETDALPRGTGDHEAALALADEFNGTHQLGFSWHFRTDPEQCRSDDAANLALRSPGEMTCGNISDEVYVRAMDEAFTFLRDHSYEPEDAAFVEDTEVVRSPVEAQHGLPVFVKLANWTIAGGQDQAPEDAFALPSPDDRVRANAAQQLAWDRLSRAQQSTMSPDGEQAVVRYQVDPETELTSREIGAFALEARDAYVNWTAQSGTWEVFGSDNEPMVTVDRPVANAHQAAALDDDLGTVLAVLGGGLLVGGAIVFRDPLAAAIATATVAIAGLWTFGLLGHADVALSELDLVQAPLVLAAGVLFTVPTIETFLQKAEDREITAAIAETGDEIAFPLSLGAFVAATGLIALGLSPLEMAADAAWTSLFGLASAFLLAITFVPAGLRLAGTRGRLVSFEEGGPWTSGPSGWTSRGVAAAVVLAVTLASVAAASGLNADAWGEPVDTWPEEDDRRGEHRAAILGFHGLDEGEAGYASNAIVVRGDVTHPEALSYLERLAEEVEAEAGETEVLEASPGRDLPSVIRDWLTVCCGAQSLAQSEVDQLLEDQQDAPSDPYPTTQQEVEATLDEMLASPYAPVVRSLVAEPTGNTVILPIAIEPGDAERAHEGWASATSALQAASAERPNDVQTAIVGPTANAHLTSEDQVPWLVYMLAAGTAMAALLALGYTRQLTGTLALALSVGLASTWLLGLLAAMDVGFTTASAVGLATGLLVAGGLGARRIWPPARRSNHARTGLFSVVLLVGVLAGLVALLDASAGFPSEIAQDGLQVAVAAIGVGYAAQALVGRALVAGEAAEPAPEATVVEATEPSEVESA